MWRHVFTFSHLPVFYFYRHFWSLVLLLSLVKSLGPPYYSCWRVLSWVVDCAFRRSFCPKCLRNRPILRLLRRKKCGISKNVTLRRQLQWRRGATMTRRASRRVHPQLPPPLAPPHPLLTPPETMTCADFLKCVRLATIAAVWSGFELEMVLCD